MHPQMYPIGCLPVATVTLASGRRINRSDYTGDGSDIVSTYDPATDDADIAAWNAGLGSSNTPNFDPKVNSDGVPICDLPSPSPLP